MFRHAVRCYPEECCGLVTHDRVRPSENHQDALHAADPAAFPRTARNGFHLAPEDQLFLARSFDTDDPVRVIYHSHVDAEAYFSEADREGATFGGDPLYAEVVHLVVAVNEREVTDARAFAFREDGFAEVARFSVERTGSRRGSSTPR